MWHLLIYRQQGGILVAGPGENNIVYLHKVGLSFSVTNRNKVTLLFLPHNDKRKKKLVI